MEKLKEEAYKFIYLTALADATRRTNYKKENLDKMKENKAVKTIVYEYLSEIMKGKHPVPKDYIYKVDYETKMLDFKFGRSQKLINMSAKYLFVSLISFADERETKHYRELFSNCDCPMDAVMIKKALEKFNDKEKNDEFWNDRKYGRRKVLVNGLSWSNIISVPDDKLGNNQYNVRTYEAFQTIINMIRDGDSNLEYDVLYYEGI